MLIVHLLAAAVWVGGSIALAAVAVPAIRTLEGEARARAMRELGLRWRPLGYAALLLLALTGIELARHDWSEGRSPFKTVLWVKVALSLCLVAVSYLHSFVLGPRLQCTTSRYNALFLVRFAGIVTCRSLVIPIYEVI